MAEETTIAPPRPRSVNTWKLPSVLRIEGDGVDPRKNRILDDRTGEEVMLPIQSLQFNVSVGQPNSIEMVLGEVAIRAVVHLVQYVIEEDDLRMLARQNGFEIQSVPQYPARITSYGPAEYKVQCRDLPGWEFIGQQPPKVSDLDSASAALRAHLDKVWVDHDGHPLEHEPSELEDGEFMLMAHHPLPEA